MAISSDLVLQLRGELKGGSKVYLPGEEGYREGIRRWSEYSEKNAVGVLFSLFRCGLLGGVEFSLMHA